MSENLIYVCVVCTVVGGLTAVEWVGIPEYRPWCCRAFPWFQPLSLPSLGSRICELGMYASPRAIALCWLNRSGRRRSRCASLSRADVKACAAPWFSDLATVCWLAFAELLSWWLANHRPRCVASMIHTKIELTLTCFKNPRGSVLKKNPLTTNRLALPSPRYLVVICPALPSPSNLLKNPNLKFKIKFKIWI